VILFSQSYPSIARWIDEQGTIEMGSDEHSGSLVRALDEGGLLWESDTRTVSIDEALLTLDAVLEDWFEQNS
jgi:hypothetical protein